MTRWIPKDMEWFLAEMIEDFSYADSEKHDVYVNTILIQAKSVEEAYAKALEKGEVYNSTYTNTDGITITTKFGGLRNLYLIYEKLEDGAEIIYEEIDDLTEEEVAALATPKEELVAFVAHGPESDQNQLPSEEEVAK